MAIAMTTKMTTTTTTTMPFVALFFVASLALHHAPVNAAFDVVGGPSSRRDVLKQTLTTSLSFVFPLMPLAQEAANAEAGRLGGNMPDPDLPPDAVRSYLQYRIPLQTSADFYVFELQELLKDTSDYGEVNVLFESKNNRGQGRPSRIESEFSNVFRIIGLSMPPDIADEMRDAQFKFERGAQMVSQATAGIRRDLPVEIAPDTVEKALAGWDLGRKGINEFLTALNSATGLSEMKTIPAPGPNQFAEYGRSRKRYVDLKKKIKLCQNRGGPNLSQAWGQLMVSGYLQDSCGIPDMESYFYQ